MPNVQMPDGTIIQDVPDGTTQSQLASKYQAHLTASISSAPNVDDAISSASKAVNAPVAVPEWANEMNQQRSQDQSILAGLAHGALQGYRSVVEGPALWMDKHFGGGNSGFFTDEGEARATAALSKTLEDKAASAPLNTITPQIADAAGGIAATAPLMGGAGKVLGYVADAAGRFVPVVSHIADFLSGTTGEPAIVKAAALGQKAPLATRAANLASRSVNSSVQGAAYAAANSTGNDDPLSTQMERGAGFGLGVPAALDAVVGSGQAIGHVIGRAIDAFSPSNAAQLAGRVLNTIAGKKGAQFADAPLPGMKLSAGQASNNPGLLSAERAMGQDPNVGGDLGAAQIDARTANNQAILGAINQVGNTDADSASAMADRIQAASDAGKVAYRAAWKAAGIDEDTTQIPVGPLKDSIQAYIGALPKAYQAIVPSSITSIVGSFGDAETLGEVQALRSHVGGLASQAARAGAPNDARVIGGLADQIGKYADDAIDPALSAMGGAPSTDPAALAAARNATKQYSQTFRQPAAIRKVLGVDKYGADQVPISATADLFIQPKTTKGAPEALQAYLTAVGNDPEGLQAARDAFASKFLNQVQSTVPDDAGDHLATPAKVTTFLNNYAHVVQSPLFTDPQRDLINRIGQASDMAARINRGPAVAGSDTAAKLAGSKYIDVLLGPGASKLMAIGAPVVAGVAAHVLGAGFYEAAAAAGGAAAGEGKLSGMLFGATRDKALQIVQQAMQDPQLAKALMTNVRPGAAYTIPIAVRSRLIAMLGTGPAVVIGGKALNDPSSQGFVPGDTPLSGFSHPGDNGP